MCSLKYYLSLLWDELFRIGRALAVAADKEAVAVVVPAEEKE